MSPRHLSFVLVSAALIAGVPRVARSNERHFTFTYESAVLPTSAKELEIWTTPRIGREEFYSRFDQRIEFEVGVTDRLMTALYLNFRSVTADVAPDQRLSEFEFTGVSSEWKYKMLDPVADALGIALYGEVTGAPEEVELETKLIVDKQLGNLLLAGNLVAESEWEFEMEGTHRELVLELDLGASYRVTPSFSVGLEIHNHNEIPEGEGFEHSALFAGPVLAYAHEEWWVALTLMPQLPALKTHEDAEGLLELDEHERFMARLLFSFHL